MLEPLGENDGVCVEVLPFEGASTTTGPLLGAVGADKKMAWLANANILDVFAVAPNARLRRYTFNVLRTWIVWFTEDIDSYPTGSGLGYLFLKTINVEYLLTIGNDRFFSACINILSASSMPWCSILYRHPYICRAKSFAPMSLSYPARE